MDSDSDSDFEGFSVNSGDSMSDIELLDNDTDIPDYYDSDDSDIVVGDHDEDSWCEQLHDIDVSSFSEFVGPRHQLPENASALDFFSLLFEPNFFDVMAEQTNLYASQRQRRAGINDSSWTPTDAQEVRAFVAINILMGLHKVPNTDAYWSMDDRLRVDGIARIMPKNRYKKLNQYLHITNNDDQPPRDNPNFDPFFKISSLANMLSYTFRFHYKPHRELTVDEAMVAFNGRHFLKQYVPSKPTKWGFKVWSLADATNGYVFVYITNTIYD